MISLKPIITEKTNCTYKAPEGMENCNDLHLEKREDRTVSTWDIPNHGILDLHVFGHQLPPVALEFHPETKDGYFNLTEKAKEYQAIQWCESEAVSMWAVPTDEGYCIMNMYDAMCFIANNDPMSMIALRLPKDVAALLEDPEHIEEFGIEMREEYFVDYHGKILI